MSLAALAAATACPSAAEAGQGQSALDIPATTLPEAVAELSREAGVSIGTEGGLPHVRTPAVHGRLSVGQALERLLAGSGYRARQVGARAWRIERAPPPRPSAPPPPVAAPAPAAALSGEEILVTAAKRPQRLSDLPLSISVVSLSDARRFDALSGTALVASEMEGMALTGLGPGRNRMFLHGVADSPFGGESQSTVAVLLDDARITYAAPDPDLRLIDVERVEVLKGPQGSLYGTGALGGIYHIVPRRADLDETGLTAAAGVEAARAGGLGHTASAVANLPLVRGAAALRLVGYSGSEPGWVDTGRRKDANETRVAGLRGTLGLAPGGGWRVDISGLAQWLGSRDSQYVYADHARSRPAQLPEKHDNDLRHLAFRAAREGSGGIDIVLSSGLTWHEVGDYHDATVGAGSFGLASPQLLEDERAYRVWDNEVRVSGHLGAASWLAGLSHVSARQADLWTLTAPAGDLTIDDDRRTTHDSALFGNLSVPLGRTFSVQAGARAFHATVRETRVHATGVFSRRRERNGLTPDLSLSWKPRAGRHLYLRYGSAIRLGGSDINAAGQLETLHGDELKTIEAGWRERLPGGGQLSLGAWYTRWTDLQSDLLQPDGLIETENAGDARIAGIEGTLELPLAQGWHLEAGGNYTMARLTRNALGQEVQNRHLPAVPDYTVRAAIRHDFVLGRADASLRAHMRYLGRARLSFDPVLDRPMGNTFEARVEALAQLDGYALTLAIDNLLDSRDDTFAYGNPLRFRTMRQFTPQAPRRVTVMLRKAW